ncbi:hypothetical protein WJX75_005218 [Coccomyxa subellipsoidea]|uniref:mTERF-domain-containing protein n=1 Tax=Coccomyxa subellipsoidea TaxID=248742 RepID=A0ABR2YU09_9CHLO
MGVNICVGGQMEAVCRSLLELNIKVRDLGQMFVRYPALITSPADKLRERADKISEWFGRGSSKVNKETCLANLITAVPKILADPDAMALLLRGTALSFDALLAVLPIQKAELEVTIRQRPLTLGTDVERARAMVKAFRAAGMEDAELTQLVQSFPAVLSASPKNLQVRLAFLTKLLGMPAHSILGAPSLFLNRSVVTTIGPRFSFIKDCLPDCTTKWAPTTILRSSDEDFCELTEAPLEQYAIYKKQWKEANGKRFQANS